MKAKEEFDKINEELANATYAANKFANVLMPTLVALGNLQYALVAIVRRNTCFKWYRKYFNRTNSSIFTT